MGNLIILYRNFTFLVLSITKLRKSSQKGIIVPYGKTVQIEFYRFIPKYFFKLNVMPVHLPKAPRLRKNMNWKNTRLSNSTKRLYDTAFGK